MSPPQVDDRRPCYDAAALVPGPAKPRLTYPQTPRLAPRPAMSHADLPFLLPLPLLLVLSALFSASETALFGLTYHERMRLARASPRAAALAAALLAEPRALLVTLLLLNNCVNVLYFVLGSVVSMRAASPLAAVVFSAVSVLALVVFGEVFPKLLAGSGRITFTRAVAGPIYWLYRLLAPVRGGVERLLIAPLARLVRPARAAEPALTVEELARLIQIGGSEAGLDQREQRLISQVVELGTLRVREVMTPRVNMVMLGLPASLAQVTELVRRTRLTRLPVVRGPGGNDVAGILATKRYLAAAASGPEPRVLDFVEPARFVPELARLDQLLEVFRSTHSQLALCVDEQGGLVGLVEIEDVARRLVAELAPGAEASPDDEVRELGPGTWTVPGRLSVRAWAQMFGLRVDSRVVTVAGLVQAMLGRLPRPGDAVELGNVRLQVGAVRGRVVERLTVSLRPETRGGHAPAEGAA